ncbi:LOW QUALITY PROTEIN: GATA zinc finger domain-containing protein 7-like [Palaemon carinicauda]|uniref:LOW QUALITY PROTEIN: GATA zinc finger domain-containing protein 7-like n=1 Tax=Palaemon carinicauda TaxID=392227 RepID=UPI0035B6893D
MRLYAPAKPSTSTGEEDGRRQEQDPSPSSFQHEDKNYHNYVSRPGELTRRSIENDPRLDDKLQLNAPRLDDKAQPIHPPRLDEKILSNGPPLSDEPTLPMTSVVDPVISTKKSPPAKTSTPPTTASTKATTTTTTTQNGPNSIDYNPPLLENGTDSLRSLDSIPWNLEGTETIIKNGSKSSIKNGSISTEEDELKKLREENKKLKAALEEAAEVNGQWRQYHDERQGYVQRLLTTIHELQHSHPSAVPSPRQLDGEGSSGGQEGEVRRLREALTRLQADHHEHVQLLEMQVRAHRDDWEAERSEKRSAEAALAETEARAALLLQELQLLQAKLADSESKRGLCWRCLCPRTDFNNHRSGSNSAPRTPQASPIPAPGGGASPAPVIPSAPPPDNPPVPLKGWIPVSMLHQIAFSGATPEHQTPVVQSQSHPQQPSRTFAPVQPQNLQNPQQQHLHQSQPQQQQQKSYYQQSQQQQNQVKQHLQVQQQPRQLQHQIQNQQQRQSTLNCMPKPVPLSSAGNIVKGSEFMPSNSPSENSAIKVGNTIGGIDDKKRYEAMGARPKVLGDLQAVVTKGIGVMEDEKSAKHRARSILASAIPVSPVSSGPSTPCGISVTRTSSNMPKGYVPITSTVLTPINFRPPFVAHKRPSAMKHLGQGGKVSSHVSSGIGNIAPPTHVRSESSPASLPSCNSNNASTAINPPANSVKKQRNDVSMLSDKTGNPSFSGNAQNASQSKENMKSSNNTQINCSNVGNSRESEKSSSVVVNTIKSPECTDGISIVTTTISCSSPCTLTTTSSSSGQNQGSKGADTSIPHTSPSTTSSVTAFASITVTTTAANQTNSNNTTSTYSSSTSSRSSSPGISLTTFGLNSEGRGIPGAICFALGCDQKGTRSPQHCVSPRRTSTSSVMSPTSDLSTAGQSQKDVKPPTTVKSPTIIINNAPPPTTVKEEHWWSVESPGRSKQQNSQSGKLVNSTWVRLMGGQANNRPGSGLPWRTARAVSGQHLNQARKLSNEEVSNAPTSPNSVSSSTATFNYTPAVNSPPSSNLSSATNSAPSSPPPNHNPPHNEDLKSMASKNISSAILSYELSAKCESVTTPTETKPSQAWSGSGVDSSMNDGVITMTRRDLVCPSCQMLFPPEKHLKFLDHFEVCRGPEYADL